MKKALIWIAVALVVLIAIVVAVQIIWSFGWPTWRDIVIVLCGTLLAIFLIVMVGVAIATLALVSLLRSKLGPLLDRAQETGDTVKGTTTFVSDRVVTPFIKVSAAAAGARAGAQALFRREKQDGQG